MTKVVNYITLAEDHLECDLQLTPNDNIQFRQFSQEVDERHGRDQLLEVFEGNSDLVNCCPKSYALDLILDKYIPST